MLVGIKWLLLLFQNSGISYLVKTSHLYFEQFFCRHSFFREFLGFYHVKWTSGKISHLTYGKNLLVLRCVKCLEARK